jgi:hypothetical protein
MTPEGLASKKVRLAASSLGFRLMRNNSGGFYDSSNNFVRFGLGNESKKLNDNLKWGDFIGALVITITPEMVGKTVAVFSDLEVKPEGALTKTINRANKVPTSREAAQLRAIELTKSWGGVSGFVTCEKDVMNVFSEFIQRLSK